VTDSLFETPTGDGPDRCRSNATSCAGVRARMDGWWTVAPARDLRAQWGAPRFGGYHGMAYAAIDDPEPIVRSHL